MPRKKIVRALQLPVEYTEAVRLLRACISLNEAKYWADKAAALAAWGHIYRSNEAKRVAAMLKIHAFQRMGQLARELRPYKPKGRSHPGPSDSGPVNALLDAGLSKSDAIAARDISAPKHNKSVEEAAAREKPPTPSALRGELANKGALSEYVKCRSALRTFVFHCRRITAARFLNEAQSYKHGPDFKLNAEIALAWLRALLRK